MAGAKDIGGFKPEQSLEDMFQRMEIKVMGKEHEDQKSEEDLSEGDDDDDDEFDLNRTFMDDPNKIS